MSFDPATLPDRQWLKLSEVVNSLALGKALDANATPPADRTYLAEIDEAIKRCCSEARNDPKCFAFVRLFIMPASSKQLRSCEAFWPPSGKRLHDMALGRERAQFSKDEPMRDAVLAWYSAQRKQALDCCVAEALANPEYSAFLDLLMCPDKGPIPTSSQLRECEAWPPYGQHLYDLVVEWERAHEQEIKRRAGAEQEILQWFLSGEVEFEGTIVEGDRRGCRERIDVNLIHDPMIFWGHDRIAAYPRDGHNPRPGEPRPMLVWDEVQIKRSSLMRWRRLPDPDPAKFDPMQEPDWTLPMAVAWIRSKSPDAVREQWDAWLEQCLERRAHEDGYYYLEPRRKASLAELIATSPENQEAWEGLRQALQNGEPTATAFHTATSERVCVPASAWAISEDQTTGRPCAPLHDESAHTDILLKSADVLHLWPKPVPEVIDIWRQPERRPHPRKGCVFLACAVDEVGKSLFADEWTGEEALVSPPDDLRHSSLSDLDKAAVTRFEKVMAEIASAAIDEKLMVLTRPAKGGDMTASPPDHWTTEVLRPRFQSGQIDVSDPFGPSPSWREGHWIFVGEKSLAMLTKRLKSKLASGKDFSRKAEEYLRPRVSKPKPQGMTNAKLKQECMAATGIRSTHYLAVWRKLAKGVMDPSWWKPGAPKSPG